MKTRANKTNKNYNFDSQNMANSTPNTPNRNEVKEAMDILKKAIQNDWAYAHGWFCNLKFAFADRYSNTLKDEINHEYAEKGAREFMKICFNYNHQDRIKELTPSEHPLQ